MRKNGLSRRDFVAGASALGVSLTTATAMAEAPAAEDTPEDEGKGDPGAGGPQFDPINIHELYTDWLGEQPHIDEALITKTVDADVVILGGGHAGTMAAKEAAKGGAKVVVVEQQYDEAMMYYGEDIGTFNSQYVQAMGYGPYDEQDILAQWMRTSGYRPNPKLVLTYIRNSGAMLDDIIAIAEAADPSILANANIQEPNTDYWTDKSQPCDMGNFKTYVGTLCLRSEILDEIAGGVASYSTMGKMESAVRAYCEDLGAEWYCNHWAEYVEKDGSGRVVAAIARNVDTDEYVRFNAAKAVVIACGAYQNNAPMCKEFFAEARELQAKNGKAAYTSTVIPTSGRDSGIGHRIGCWAGGRMEAGPSASLANVSGPGPFGFAPTLLLNRDGKRFMNEADFNAMGNQINRQPTGLYCNVFDANYEDIISRGGTNHGGVDFGQKTYVAQWREDMTKVVDAGAAGYVVRHGCLTERADMGQTPVYGAQTLEELAGYLGYEGEAIENFVASVTRYNELCAEGYDADFGKKADFMLPISTPPFYGSAGDTSGQAGTAVALGGLVTDENFNVMGDDDTPIPGLYAVGNCCGDRYCLTYPGILAGNSIGMAMTNGYVCGQVVAAL